MTKQEKAIELHDRGCNCAQAVACAFAEEIGVPEETLFARGGRIRTRHGRHGGNLRSGLRSGDACGLQEQLCRSKEPEDQGGQPIS